MKKWREETKDVLAALAGIGGGMLLADSLSNPRPAKVAAGLALILATLLLAPPARISRIFKKRRLAEKKAIV